FIICLFFFLYFLLLNFFYFFFFFSSRRRHTRYWRDWSSDVCSSDLSSSAWWPASRSTNTSWPRSFEKKSEARTQARARGVGTDGLWGRHLPCVSAGLHFALPSWLSLSAAGPGAFADTSARAGAIAAAVRL